MKLNLGALELKEEGWDTIDINTDNNPTILADLNKQLPIEDKRYDNIKGNHVLEHLENPIRTLDEFHRILKKNGIIKISVPYCFHQAAYSNPEHKYFFGRGWFENYELLYNKFKILNINYCPSKATKFFPSFLNRFLSYFLNGIYWQIEVTMIKYDAKGRQDE